MPEPSLQDILSMRSDPELATGNTGIVYDTKDLVHTLNQAAQQKAENDWRKYNMFMGNLKEVYKDLNEIAKQPVLTEDRDKLKQTMGEIMKGISSDPRGFFGGGAKYQETLARLAQLQSETTESKQNNLYDTAHRQYFYANPNLATPKNMALIDDYRKQPLGSRNPYMLELPPMFDMKGALDNLNKIAVSKTETPTGAGHIENVEGVDQTKWNEAARALFFTGKDVKEYFAQRFEEAKKASPSSVAPYANSQNPVLDFYLDLMKGGQQATSMTLTGDTAWQTKQQEAGATKRTGMQVSAQLETNKRSIKAQMVAQGYVPFDPKNPVEIYDPILKMTRKAKETDAIKDPNFGELYVPGSKLQSTTLLNTSRATAAQKAQALGSNSPLATDDYWADHISPQLGKVTTKYKVAPDFTGDIDVTPKDLSGVDVAIWDQVEEGAKNNKVSELSIRYENGKPVGLLINGQFYNSLDINSKANEKAIHLMGPKEPNPYSQQ